MWVLQIFNVQTNFNWNVIKPNWNWIRRHRECIVYLLTLTFLKINEKNTNLIIFVLRFSANLASKFKKKNNHAGTAPTKDDIWDEFSDHH